ncbi:glycoside hydrolase family 19 [Kribbella sandramycini]|uniref:Glycoside hydrolase family 19 n=1 Tax=Kribbella sandramycini TaxID=60450 RepID=A0A7Y4P518_9ACTN|nr:glycoside hydrolase family 19 protein [Kribbella sandramycini]MBB6570165.1 putative chitinase [Kribbella sandramycini]NOL45710.1 glycoside hydrolase family 19 [Kribbella sandramycini]
MILRRLSTALLAGLGVVAAGLVAATPAQAAVFSTYGTGVNVRADAYLNATIVRTLPGPTQIDVDCQKRGDRVTTGEGTSEWWAHVPALGGYVSVVFVAIPEDKLPGVAECTTEPEPPWVDVTYADIDAMFRSRIAKPETVKAGLPSLNQAMREAQINTPYRKAAFLATLVHESRLEYDIREIGDTRPYGGRGYIQLTTEGNYRAAGNYLGVNLIAEPEKARSLEWSAPIARWYWTVARNINPMADALKMGRVNAAIGYPAGAEDGRRCESFRVAIAYFTGQPAPVVNCSRTGKMEADTSGLTRAEFDALAKQEDSLSTQGSRG